MNCPSRSISGSRQCRAVCATLSRLSRSKVSHGGSRIMTPSTHCAAKFAKKPAQTTSHPNLGKSVGCITADHYHRQQNAQESCGETERTDVSNSEDAVSLKKKTTAP